MAKKSFKSAAELFLSATEIEPEAPKPETPKQEKKAAGVNVPKGYKLVKENKSERMQLLIRPTIKESIRNIAAAQGLSMNDLINNIFEEYIERWNRS